MNLEDKIPSYLTGRTQLAATVVFAAFFAVVVLIVTVQYDTHNWFEIGPTATFGYTTLFILASILILSVSKRLMFRAARRVMLSWGRYIVWNLAEMAAIAILYTCLTAYLQGIGIISIPDVGVKVTLGRSFLITVLLTGIPYVIAGLYYAVQDRDNTIRLLNYGNVVTDTEPDPLEREKVTLFGDDGVMKLSISIRNIFYIESDDNYIKVWYSDNKGGLQTYMLRCRLKTVEESFAGSDLIRCHRKFIVNMGKVKVLQKVGATYEITLDNEAIAPIPVTKTYIEGVLERFKEKE